MIIRRHSSKKPDKEPVRETRTNPAFVFDVSVLQLSLALDEVQEFCSENYCYNSA